MQEASIDLPKRDLLDRSINILVLGGPEKPFSVVVTRDYLDQFPDVDALLKDQIHQLSHKEKKFVEHEFINFSVRRSQPNVEDATGHGAEVAVSYVRQEKNVHQRIALITLPKRLILAINGTFTEKWSDSMQSEWRKLIESVELY